MNEAFAVTSFSAEKNSCVGITYPGVNNFSDFTFDGLGRNIKIVETTSGSVTSTRQFVWSDTNRLEERDSSGVLTKKFFARGQQNSATKYFYGRDHLGSVREMTDNSGTVQAEYGFDPFGNILRLQETVACDFGYVGYCLHLRSDLNLTRTRSYSSRLGRWINRDPIAENGGMNLYSYTANDPALWRDPSGLFTEFQDQINCIGSACGRNSWVGPNVDGKKESFKQMWDELGYKCDEVTNSFPKCECEILFFIYPGSTGGDPWTTDYDYNEGPDYHAVNNLSRGTGPNGQPDPSKDTWGSQQGAFSKSDPQAKSSYKVITGDPRNDPYIPPGSRLFCCNKKK